MSINHETNFFLVTVLSIQEYFVTTEPIVTINDGVVKGKYLVTKYGRTISGFMGIPFAKPPVGPLRFEPPQPVDPWEDTLDANFHVECPQRNIYVIKSGYVGEEDCLYLNVYTPLVSNFEAKNLSVMVWLHGGGFLAGSGHFYKYSPQILLDRDVILVTINYRLGPLGFFTTGDEVVSGNNGLKDQNFALTWVQKNIRQFGGDPNSVTLFGESAGGASIHYHLLSPLSKGLFKGGILQSGTAFCPWALAAPNEGLNNSMKLATIFNCPTTSSQEMVECLKKVDIKRLLRTDVEFRVWDYDPMVPFKPVIEPNVEGAFLTKDPEDIIQSGEAADVPLMIGLTRDEGALKSARIYGSHKLMEELSSNFTAISPVLMQYDKWFPSDVFDTVTQLIDGFYFEYEKLGKSKIKQITELISDGWFFYPADKAMRLHSQHYKQPIYVYLLEYRGSHSFTEIFGGGDYDFGVSHADDLLYLFPFNGLFKDSISTENDKNMSKLMIKLWTNFATTGNPTPQENNDGLSIWKPYGAQEEYYALKNHTFTKTTFGGIVPERIGFWRQLIAEYGIKQHNIFS